MKVKAEYRYLATDHIAEAGKMVVFDFQRTKTGYYFKLCF